MAAPKPTLFRTLPSRELVAALLQACGLRGFQDTHWFSKGEIRLQEVEPLLVELEPYYLPCKAARFFHDGGPPTTSRAVTILRQVLRPHGYELHVQERKVNGVKQPLYQLSRTDGASDLDWSPSLTVDFT